MQLRKKESDYARKRLSFISVGRLLYYFSRRVFAIPLIRYPVTHVVGFLYRGTNSFHAQAYRGKITGSWLTHDGLPQIHTVDTMKIGWRLQLELADNVNINNPLLHLIYLSYPYRQHGDETSVFAFSHTDMTLSFRLKSPLGMRLLMSSLLNNLKF